MWGWGSGLHQGGKTQDVFSFAPMTGQGKHWCISILLSSSQSLFLQAALLFISSRDWRISHTLGKHRCRCGLSHSEGKMGARGKAERPGVKNRRVGRGRCKGLCVCVGGCVWRRLCGRLKLKEGKERLSGNAWRERERDGWRLMQVGGTIWWLIGSEICRQLAKVKAASAGVLLISGSMCWCMCHPCWETKQVFLLMPQSAGSNLKSISGY